MRSPTLTLMRKLATKALGKRATLIAHRRTATIPSMCPHALAGTMLRQEPSCRRTRSPVGSRTCPRSPAALQACSGRADMLRSEAQGEVSMTGEVGGQSIQTRPDARPVPLVVWTARLSVYFLLQGAVLLLAYAYYGFDTDPQSFPPGQRLDPLHAGVQLLWGIAGTYAGFVRPRLATPFMLAFAAFYTLLAILGTFTRQHFGMHLELPPLTARLLGASTLVSVPMSLLAVGINRYVVAAIPLVMMLTYRVLQLLAGVIYHDRFPANSLVTLNYFGGGTPDGHRFQLSALGGMARNASTREGAEPAHRTSALAPSTFRACRSWPAWLILRGTWSRVPDARRQCQAAMVRRFRHHTADSAALRFAADRPGARACSRRARQRLARGLLCRRSAWRPSAFSARFR